METLTGVQKPFARPSSDDAREGSGNGTWFMDADEQANAALQCVSERRLRSYTDLVEFCRSESSFGVGAETTTTVKTRPAPAHPPKMMLTREELASMVIQGPSPGESFQERLAKRAKALGIAFPTVVVEFKDLTVSTEALVGSAAMPTLTNSVMSTIKRTLLPGSLKTKPLSILQGVSGAIKPGRMTLLLGPPNAGKTTLLKVLSGRLAPTKTLKIDGDVTYNGVEPSEFLVQRTVGYVDQNDEHIPLMSVQDTLDFAYRCQTGNHEVETNNFDPRAAMAADSASKMTRSSGEIEEYGTGVDDFLHTGVLPDAGLSDHQFDRLVRAIWGTGAKVDVIMKLMGLYNARDTIVGDTMTRGVSGGERKRVTTAEMIVGPRHVLCLDEISTGLDSATLFSIMRFMAVATRALQSSTIIALLQPPPEVMDLFDDILLLTDGRTLYHGPMNGALDFFSNCGFDCPVSKDKGSFMQEVTTAIGQAEFANAALRSKRGLPAAFDVLAPPPDMIVTLDDFSKQFWTKNKHGIALKSDLDRGVFDKSDKPNDRALAHKHYALSWFAMLKLVSNRQLTLLMNDKSLTRGRMLQVIVIALIIGSMWFDLDATPQNARSFFGVSFMSCLFLAIGSFPQMQTVRITRAVFFKQRANNFYPASCYGLGLFWATVPTSMLETILYSTIVYFMVGFTASAGAFFTFVLIVSLVVFSFASIVRVIAVAAPSEVATNSVASLVLLLLVLFSGFSIVRTSIPDYWIWAFYISPLAWGLQAIVINEMSQSRWGNEFISPVTGPSGLTEGETALESFSFRTDEVFIWYGCIYMAATIVVMTLLTNVVLAYIQPPTTTPTVPDEAAMAAYRKEVEARRKTMGGGKIEGTSMGFEPVTITFIDLKYFVPNPHKGEATELQLLQGNTGVIIPGKLTALMGGSGAGKTTFMDTIAGRKTVGRIEGKILINGYPMQKSSWSRTLAYVEQADIHSPQLTVLESLVFSSDLRLPRGTTKEERMNHVSSTLDTVDLTDIMESMVGVLGSGLSTEQRKRLTIGVELVSNPSAVFMDEPTSGLDARAAATVVRAVRKIADSGRTVVVTVHQPSIDIFYAFDSLILFAKGGRTVYYGSLGLHSHSLIDYLQHCPGVTPIRPGYNPATWMLEVTGGSMAAGATQVTTDFAQLYKDSELSKMNYQKAIESETAGLAAGKEIVVKTTYASSFLTQVGTLSNKFRSIYFRKPDYNVMRYIMTIIISLVLGTTYLDVGKPSVPADITDIQSVMGVLYTLCTFMGMINLMSSMPVVGQERAVFYRERASSMYSSFPFAIAASSVEIPYILLQSIVFCPITFFLVGFNNDDGWQFWYFTFMVFLTIVMYTFMGQLLAYSTPSQQVAMVLASGLNFLFNILNGFTLPYTDIPAYWQWLNRCIPTTWVLYGLAASQLGNNNNPLIDTSGVETTISVFMEGNWGYRYNFRWQCVIIVIGFIIVFRVGSIFSLKLLNFQTR